MIICETITWARSRCPASWSCSLDTQYPLHTSLQIQIAQITSTLSLYVAINSVQQWHRILKPPQKRVFGQTCDYQPSLGQENLRLLNEFIVQCGFVLTSMVRMSKRPKNSFTETVRSNSIFTRSADVPLYHGTIGKNSGWFWLASACSSKTSDEVVDGEGIPECWRSSWK